jgi:uncharacterized protein YkwD
MKTFLTAAISTIACAMLASVALAARPGTGHHHGRHAQVVCTVKANRKHHGRRPGKQAHKCVRRANRRNGVHSIGGDPGNPRSTPAGHIRRVQHSTIKPASHQPSSHQSSRPKETTLSAAPSDAATIAKVLNTSCENTELMPEAGNLEAVEQSTLCLVNQERARNGELPLRLNADLGQAAEGHSAEMVADDYFAHVSPSGETPLQRIEASGYIPNSQVGYTIGENIAWGTLYLATPKAIVAAWLASPEHLANILNAAYTETGLGVASQAPASLSEGQPGAIYSQEFGVIEG